jgi:hypothetical protein
MSAQEVPSQLHLSPDHPWPGLQSFDEASESFYFGMRVQTDALFRLVRREILTLFYGRSGLGKTSLLQAGLFPRLREANLLPIPIRLVYGEKALPFARQVKQAVASALSGAGIDARSSTETESLWEYFHSSNVDFWDSENRLITLVLVFDQFEERFTLGRQLAETDSQVEVFLTEISQLVENRPPPFLKTQFEAHAAGVGNYDFDKHSCKVILSLREDFLPELENLRDRFPSILAAEYIRIDYWPNGLEKQLSFFDRTENPRIGLDGAYAIHTDYDSLNLPKRVVAMDAHGSPMTNKEGVAITEFNRDARGNPTEELTLDAAGKPALNKEGWCRAIWTYDDYGNPIESSWFDASGKLCMVTAGSAKERCKYDEHGNQIESRSFDTDDRPCLNKYGFASAKLKYDERGNGIEFACFDTSGKPCLSKYGSAKGTIKYDERGNVIESTSFDISGKPSLNQLGVARATRKNDDRSNWIAMEFYGVDGQRCLTREANRCEEMRALLDLPQPTMNVITKSQEPISTKTANRLGTVRA